MASLQFTDRFKNKTQIIGKSGPSSLTTSNPAQTEEPPESKLHPKIPSYFPSLQKIRILKFPKSDSKTEESETLKSLRSITPTTLPTLRQSPPRPLRNSNSPDTSEALTSTSLVKPSQSYQGKLPNLHPKFYNIRRLLPS
jgi:hypothetical protein